MGIDDVGMERQADFSKLIQFQSVQFHLLLFHIGFIQQAITMVLLLI